jgi:hypothetical protein
VAVLENPCIAFKELVTKKLNNSIRLQNECEKFYEENINSLIQRQCEHSEDIAPISHQNHHVGQRTQHYVQLLVGVLSGVVSWGIGALFHHYEDTPSTKVLSELEVQLEQKVNKFKDVMRKFEKGQEVMEKLMKQNWQAYKSLSEKIHNEAMVTDMSILVMNQMTLLHTHLLMLFSGIQEGRVDPVYETLFPKIPKSIETPWQRACVYESVLDYPMIGLKSLIDHFQFLKENPLPKNIKPEKNLKIKSKNFISKYFGDDFENLSQEKVVSGYYILSHLRNFTSFHSENFFLIVPVDKHPDGKKRTLHNQYDVQLPFLNKNWKIDHEEKDWRKLIKYQSNVYLPLVDSHKLENVPCHNQHVERMFARLKSLPSDRHEYVRAFLLDSEKYLFEPSDSNDSDNDSRHSDTDSD